MSTINEQIEQATAAACELLRLNLHDVFWLQIDAADKWLAEWIGPYQDDIAVMKSTPEFWTWWRQQWAAVDRELVDRMSKLRVAELLKGGNTLARYGQCHAHARSYRPNRVVMESFHRQVIKKSTDHSRRSIVK